MKQKQPIPRVSHPDKITSYFALERSVLVIVTISGLLYNVGMIAGPFFEGQLAQCLYDILRGTRTMSDMVALALTYVAVILAVQGMRCLKRFYIRRFANDTGRYMRHTLYSNLVRKTKQELELESTGALMTRAISDVDACVEGMRKFTTEIFDTGVVLLAYLAMLFVYDWRLALIASAFQPLAYLLAERLKKAVYRYHAAYKSCAGQLNDATMDRVGNAVLYRVNGREAERNQDYSAHLAEYEKKSAQANIWENTPQPIYNVAAMIGVIFILYFGGKNVLGSGWNSWNIAAFTTFLSCFAKLALKASKAAKLFNSVQKAQVSWKRIHPLMKEVKEEENTDETDSIKVNSLTMQDAVIGYENSDFTVSINHFTANAGQIIGVAGAVAGGKSTIGRVFLQEAVYQGSIRLDQRALSSMDAAERSRVITYMGHQPELMSDTITENICLGESADAKPFLRAVCLEDEVAEMPQGSDTYVGSGGIRLSGGQQARVALARTLYHAKSVLILDDPFSAVDLQTEQKIMKQLKQLAAGKIVFLISHRLRFFSQTDQVIWVENGSTVIGTHRELLRRCPAYAQSYQLQGGDTNGVE